MRRIVKSLRDELRSEVRRVERSLRVAAEGMPVSSLIASEASKVSPLGLYIAAYRVGGRELAERFAVGTASQHASCPLYRDAARSLLPEGAYPGPGLEGAMAAPPIQRRPRTQEVHLN